MKKWEPHYNEYLENLSMKGYQEGYAARCMYNDILCVIDKAKKRKITAQQKRELLNELCPGWSDGDIYDFMYGTGSKRKKKYEQLKKDNTATWKKYMEEGKEEYFRNRDREEKYGEMQNKIVDYAEQNQLLKSREIAETYHYGVVITMARRMMEYGNDFHYAATCLKEWNLLDEEELMKIARIMERASFDRYRKKLKDYVKGKITEKEYRSMGEERLAILVDIMVELIYRMYIRGEENIDTLEEILKETEHPFRILMKLESALREYLSNIYQIIAARSYPVEVILQILGYPALNFEEYEERVFKMRMDVGKLISSYHSNYPNRLLYPY